MASNDSFLDAATEVDASEREPPFTDHPRPPPQRTKVELDQLIEQGLPHVMIVARALRRRLGHLCEVDELASVGRVSLLETARSFDPTRAEFVPYLRKKVRWAMLDSVRRDTHGRSISARARGLAAAERVRESMVAGPPDPTLAEAAHARVLRTTLAAQAAAMATSFAASLPASGQASSATVKPTPNSQEQGGGVETCTPEEQVASARFRSALSGALVQLPPRQQEIVRRHYFDDERFDHIAESMGISKSWASRLHAQAMELLAGLLGEHR